MGGGESAHRRGELTPERSLRASLGAESGMLFSKDLHLPLPRGRGCPQVWTIQPVPGSVPENLKVKPLTGWGADTGGRVSVSTLRVSPGLCPASVLAVVFVGGIGGRTCLILFPQKPVWEDKKCVCFIHPGGSL